MATLSPRVARDLKSGSRLGRYVLEEPIGFGHTSEVWTATVAARQRRVAIKLLRADWVRLGSGRFAFDNERTALQRVEHPAVIRFEHGGWHCGERPFLVLEHLEGETLELRLQRTTLSPSSLTPFAATMAAALHAVHRSGLLHLDVRPANVMLLDQAGFHAILFDFGSAVGRALGRERGYVGVRSPGLCAPEVERGDPVDERTDLWGLGNVLLAAAGGSLGRLSPTWRAVLARLMADDPADRPASAAMVADLLQFHPPYASRHPALDG